MLLIILEVSKPIKNNQESFKSKIMLLIERLFLDSDAGRDWGQEEKGMTEDEMAGWHH